MLPGGCLLNRYRLAGFTIGHDELTLDELFAALLLDVGTDFIIQFRLSPLNLVELPSDFRVL